MSNYSDYRDQFTEYERFIINADDITTPPEDIGEPEGEDAPDGTE